MVVTAQHMLEWEARATHIVMIELLGVLAAIDHLALRLRGRRAILLVDSEPVESALIIGGSNKEDMNELATIFWDIVLRNDICLFITRVPTDSNPADGPSRGFFRELELRGGKWETMSPSDKVLSIKARRELVNTRLWGSPC